MAFQNSDSDSVLSEINITPLVDVMLVLLVSFIVTIPVMHHAVHINLPQTVAAPSPPDQNHTVTISLDHDGHVFVDQREVAVGALQAALVALKAQHADLGLNLQVDKGLAFDGVAKVMTEIEQAGISRVSVLTAPPQGG